MKILCVVSEGAGHLDFGGMGFVKLARQLAVRGHEVTWISCNQQVHRLRTLGFEVEDQPVTHALSLNYFIPENAIETNLEKFRWLLNQIRYFHDLILARGPNLIIFDRLLTYGAMAAEQARIPYIGVGTPGGYWRKEATGTRPHAGPVPEYVLSGKAISNQLEWDKGSLNSFWVSSPLLNITFIARDFYAPPAEIPGAQVHHFSTNAGSSRRDRVGISFGNEGTHSILKAAMECMLQVDRLRDPVEVFLGNQKGLLLDLESKYRSGNVSCHGWVNFADYFPKLKYLAFFGGIGTIWHCIDNQVPMLIVPGLIGDQWHNGQMVSKLGLGECLPAIGNECGNLYQILGKLDDSRRYDKQISTLHARSNYSDSMDTVCEKLEALSDLPGKGRS